VLADADLLEPARVLRRRMGGAMRQAGVLAAAALFALRHNIQRLAEDHARARRLADAVADVAPGSVRPTDVETNIVIVDLASTSLDAATVAARCRADGVLVSAFGPRLVRLVTHLDVDDAGIDRAVAALRRILSGRRD
jgi:threonine aldolase